jgi:hypothetical protein
VPHEVVFNVAESGVVHERPVEMPPAVEGDVPVFKVRTGQAEPFTEVSICGAVDGGAQGLSGRREQEVVRLFALCGNPGKEL